MPSCLRPLRRAFCALAIAAAALPAQQPAPREFATQDILIPAFEGKDIKLGRAVASEARDRLAKLADKKDLNIVSGWAMDGAMYRAGFDDSKPVDAGLVRSLAQTMRADEYVRGAVERTPDGIRLTADLVLTRERRLYQPLPAIVGKSANEVGQRLAIELADARKQMVHQRRCENAVRLNDAAAAIAAARAGISAYPRATLVRTCLVVALLLRETAAQEILDAANAVLAELPNNYWALEAVAQAHDAMNERDKAAKAWLKVVATDTANLDLAARVARQLAEHNNSAAAEPLILRVSDAHPDDLSLRRIRFDVLYRNRKWRPARDAGLTLFNSDSASRSDPQFVLRYATVLKNLSLEMEALSTIAQGVLRFPDDAKLYELYAQFIRDEAPGVVTRGLERFPKSAPLTVMQSRDLKAKGNAEAALAASKRALSLDPSMQHGYLTLAQGQLELNQADSALASLRMALATGEDSLTVAQFALARGNGFFRTAGTSQNRDEFQRAFRWLAYADSLRPSVQSQFLYGASALSVLQGAAVDAPAQKSCDLARQAQGLMPLATEKLTAGAAVSADAVRQYLARLDQLAPVIERQVATFCTPGER